MKGLLLFLVSAAFLISAVGTVGVNLVSAKQQVQLHGQLYSANKKLSDQQRQQLQLQYILPEIFNQQKQKKNQNDISAQQKLKDDKKRQTEISKLASAYNKQVKEEQLQDDQQLLEKQSKIQMLKTQKETSIDQKKQVHFVDPIEAKAYSVIKYDHLPVDMDDDEYYEAQIPDVEQESLKKIMKMSENIQQSSQKIQELASQNKLHSLQSSGVSLQQNNPKQSAKVQPEPTISRTLQNVEQQLNSLQNQNKIDKAQQSGVAKQPAINKDQQNLEKDQNKKLQQAKDVRNIVESYNLDSNFDDDSDNNSPQKFTDAELQSQIDNLRQVKYNKQEKAKKKKSVDPNLILEKYSKKYNQKDQEDEEDIVNDTLQEYKGNKIPEPQNTRSHIEEKITKEQQQIPSRVTLESEKQTVSEINEVKITNQQTDSQSIQTADVDDSRNDYKKFPIEEKSQDSADQNIDTATITKDTVQSNLDHYKQAVREERIQSEQTQTNIPKSTKKIENIYQQEVPISTTENENMSGDSTISYLKKKMKEKIVETDNIDDANLQATSQETNIRQSSSMTKNEVLSSQDQEDIDRESQRIIQKTQIEEAQNKLIEESKSQLITPRVNLSQQKSEKPQKIKIYQQQNDAENNQIEVQDTDDSVTTDSETPTQSIVEEFKDENQIKRDAELKEFDQQVQTEMETKGDIQEDLESNEEITDAGNSPDLSNDSVITTNIPYETDNATESENESQIQNNLPVKTDISLDFSISQEDNANYTIDNTNLSNQEQNIGDLEDSENEKNENFNQDSKLDQDQSENVEKVNEVQEFFSPQEEQIEDNQENLESPKNDDMNNNGVDIQNSEQNQNTDHKQDQENQSDESESERINDSVEFSSNSQTEDDQSSNEDESTSNFDSIQIKDSDDTNDQYSIETPNQIVDQSEETLVVEQTLGDSQFENDQPESQISVDDLYNLSPTDYDEKTESQQTNKLYDNEIIVEDHSIVEEDNKQEQESVQIQEENKDVNQSKNQEISGNDQNSSQTQQFFVPDLNQFPIIISAAPENESYQNIDNENDQENADYQSSYTNQFDDQNESVIGINDVGEVGKLLIFKKRENLNRRIDGIQNETENQQIVSLKPLQSAIEQVSDIQNQYDFKQNSNKIEQNQTVDYFNIEDEYLPGQQPIDSDETISPELSYSISDSLENSESFGDLPSENIQNQSPMDESNDYLINQQYKQQDIFVKADPETNVSIIDSQENIDTEEQDFNQIIIENNDQKDDSNNQNDEFIMDQGNNQQDQVTNINYEEHVESNDNAAVAGENKLIVGQKKEEVEESNIQHSKLEGDTDDIEIISEDLTDTQITAVGDQVQENKNTNDDKSVDNLTQNLEDNYSLKNSEEIQNISNTSSNQSDEVSDQNQTQNEQEVDFEDQNATTQNEFIYDKSQNSNQTSQQDTNKVNEQSSSNTNIEDNIEIEYDRIIQQQSIPINNDESLSDQIVNDQSVNDYDVNDQSLKNYDDNDIRQADNSSNEKQDDSENIKFEDQQIPQPENLVVDESLGESNSSIQTEILNNGENNNIVQDDQRNVVTNDDDVQNNKNSPEEEENDQSQNIFPDDNEQDNNSQEYVDQNLNLNNSDDQQESIWNEPISEVDDSEISEKEDNIFNFEQYEEQEEQRVSNEEDYYETVNFFPTSGIKAQLILEFDEQEEQVFSPIDEREEQQNDNDYETSIEFQPLSNSLNDEIENNGVSFEQNDKTNSINNQDFEAEQVEISDQVNEDNDDVLVQDEETVDTNDDDYVYEQIQTNQLQKENELDIEQEEAQDFDIDDETDDYDVSFEDENLSFIELDEQFVPWQQEEQLDQDEQIAVSSQFLPISQFKQFQNHLQQN